MKDYIFTIFLVLCIIIVIIGIVGIFMYFEEDSSSNISNETYQTNEILNQDETDNTTENEITNVETDEENQQDDTEENTNIEDEENVLEAKEEEEPILNQIVAKYNASEATQEMIASGYSLRAILNGNEILVATSGAGLSFKQSFYLEENILYTTIETDVEDSRETLIRILLANTLLDSVAQVKGHPQRKLTQAMLTEESKNYTIENEGVQVIDEDPIIMKIDISKDFEFLNNL